MPTADTTLIGNRYRLLAQIGSGGMGTVWRGHDVLLDREVAVKEIVVPPQIGAEERKTMQARAMREARTAARLDDPSVVSVYDVVDDGDRPWIVMELVRGRTVGQTVKAQGYLSSPYVAAIGLAVLRALRAAHRAGILHRDVKPSNVILADDGRIVLTDFGVATIDGDPAITTTGLLVGSPAYMAPERARGERPSPAADLWSLGATLYAAVQGAPPFERGGALATLTAAIIEPHPPADRASPELRDAIDGFLVKDPAARLDDASATRLLRAAAGAPAPAAPATPAPTATLRRATPPASIASIDPVQDPVTVGPAAPVRPGPVAARTAPAPQLAPRRTRRRPFAAWATLAIAAVAIGLLVGYLSLRETGTGTGAGEDTGQVAAGGDTGAAATPQTGVSVAPTGTAQPSTPAPGPTAGSQPTAETTSDAVDPGATSPPADDTTSVGASIPAGFFLHEDPTGFSVAVPDGWDVVREGSMVDFEDPASSAYLRIDQTDDPKDDPLADWIAQEQTVSQRLTNYELIRIDGLDYRGWESADWEFVYGESGTHVLNRNVVTGPMAYAIYWSVPVGQWDAGLSMFDVFAATFQPAG